MIYYIQNDPNEQSKHCYKIDTYSTNSPPSLLDRHTVSTEETTIFLGSIHNPLRNLRSSDTTYCALRRNPICQSLRSAFQCQVNHQIIIARIQTEERIRDSTRFSNFPTSLGRRENILFKHLNYKSYKLIQRFKSRIYAIDCIILSNKLTVELSNTIHQFIN